MLTYKPAITVQQLFTLGYIFFVTSLSATIIKDDFLLNDDIIGGANQETPMIAVDNFGNTIVVWTDFRDGNADIYCQRFDSTGSPLNTNFRVNQDVGMMWQGEPSIAISNHGNFIIAWEDRRDYNSDVYIQRFNPQGIPLGTNVRVNDNQSTSDQRNADIVILPNQSFVVVWDDWRNDWGDIYAQRFDSLGNPIGNNFRVNDDIYSSTQYSPSIVCDTLGNFIIAWQDGRQGNWDIYAQRYNAQGIALGTNFRVNDDVGSTEQTSPSIACIPNGEFIIVWQDKRQGNDDIYCQRFDAFGNRIGNNFQVNTDNTSTAQIQPAIAATNNNFIVVWADCRNNNYDIYYQLYNDNGNPIGVNTKVNDDVTSHTQSEPAVAMYQSNNFIVVWKDHRNINGDIFCQRYQSNSIPVGSNMKINNDIASAHQRCSWISQDGFGNYLISWEDERNHHCDIYGVCLDSLGNILSSNFKVNDDTVAAEQYYASNDRNFNGDFIITWTDNRNGNFDVYGQRYLANSTPIGTNFRINDDSTQFAQYYPIVSCDSIGNSVVVWIDYRNNDNDIYGQRFDYQGNPLGTNFIINQPASGSQLYPYVAKHRSGNFVVVWMDNRNGNYDIYGQRFDANGLALGANFRVNDDIGNSYQGYPSVTLDVWGNFYVAWEDKRNGCTDIYLQKFDHNGNPIGANIKVDDDNIDGSQYSPTLSCDETGRLVVVWCDFRNFDDDPEIYAQAFNSNLSPIGNNQMVNQSDLFLANNQWLIGQGVSCNNRRIAFAWIDNRRHQGWDIYAKIVQWAYFTAVDDNLTQAQTNSLIIFPNPTSGKILLKSNNGTIKDLQLFNSLGSKVANISIKDYQQQKDLQIDLSHLTAGVYFLRYNLEDKSETKKIILNTRRERENN